MELNENQLKDVNGGAAINKTHLIMYIVKRGDTLCSIAAKFNTTEIIIRQLNRISNNKILAGQKLLVPIN